jgi:hypothetical protein
MYTADYQPARPTSECVLPYLVGLRLVMICKTPTIDEFVQLTMRTKQNEGRKGNLPIPPFSYERYRSSGTICYNLTIPSNAEANLHLQSIGKSLVHLGDLGRNAKINGAVTNFNDESTNEVGVDLIYRVSKQPLNKNFNQYNAPWQQP